MMGIVSPPRRNKRYAYRWFLVFGLLFAGLTYAQETSLDFKVSNVGPVRQVVTNIGLFGEGSENNRPFIGYGGPITCEYPAGQLYHYGTFTIWVGGIRSEVSRVSTRGPWGPAAHFGNTFELFPTAEPWDTVWVVEDREIVDIPYWLGYQGVSDQDLVCRYE